MHIDQPLTKSKKIINFNIITSRSLPKPTLSKPISLTLLSNLLPENIGHAENRINSPSTSLSIPATLSRQKTTTPNDCFKDFSILLKPGRISKGQTDLRGCTSKIVYETKNCYSRTAANHPATAKTNENKKLFCSTFLSIRRQHQHRRKFFKSIGQAYL